MYRICNNYKLYQSPFEVKSNPTANRYNFIYINIHIHVPYYVSLIFNEHMFSFLLFRILSLHEYGLINKWKDYRWPQKFCDDQKKTSVDNISVEDIQSAFYLIGIGICLSCISLLCEQIIRFKSKEQRNKPNTICK